jgi:hypothetical protein
VTQIHTASKKNTVRRSLACGAATEKPKNWLREASYRQIDCKALDGWTASITVWVVQPG